MTAEMETETRRAELYVNAALMGEFKTRVKRMNKRASKLGLEGVSFHVTGTEEVRVSKERVGAYRRPAQGTEKGGYFALYNVVEVTGDMPKLAGWRFVATVDLRGSTPVVKAMPFVEEDFGVDLTPYRHTDCRCEHCNTMRRRNDVLVIQKAETGETMQIGRNCAADFFRHEGAVGLLNVSDWVEQLSGGLEETSGARVERIVTLKTLFEVAAAVVRTFGWVSRPMAMADDKLASTRSRVIDNLFPHLHMKKEEFATITDADRAEAEAVIAWVMQQFVEKPEDQRTSFEHNVAAVIERPDGRLSYVRASNVNYLIWAINGYKRAEEKRVEAERRERVKQQARETSAHVGEVGERIEVEVKLVLRRGFGSQFGTMYLCKFEDAQGNCLIWKSTSGTASDLLLNETYKLKATIKGHSEYDGTLQTELTRAKVLEGKLESEEEHT